MYSVTATDNIYSSSTQKQVYTETAAPIVAASLDGYNGTFSKSLCWLSD